MTLVVHIMRKKRRALGFTMLGFGSLRFKNVVGLWKFMQWKKNTKGNLPCSSTFLHPLQSSM
jgi:hypothetical protein